MAATCLDVVTAAMRLSRIIGPGKDPKASEGELGLQCLQSLYDSWLSNGMFGRLADVYLTFNDTAQEGKRYFVPTGFTLADASSVYLDLDGVTRQPRDLSAYEALTEAGVRTVRIYDRTQWVDPLDLTLTDDAPLGSRGLMGLAACLATSGAFTAAFGATPPAETRQLAGQFLAGLSYKIGSTRDRAMVEYF